MKRYPFRLAWFSLLLLSLLSCTSQKQATSSRPLSTTTIDTLFRHAAGQYAVLMKNLPPDRFPKTYHFTSDKLETSGSDWWCSGFYPGTLLSLYQQTGEQTLQAEAQRMLALLEKEKNNKGTHDLGFMMFCSFGKANKLAPNPAYIDILLTSARSLSSRFNEKVGCIRSWNSKPSDFIVIIDNMMNLELLFWATRFSGDSSFYKIAVTHANTTLKNHFRPDNSSYHVLNYNPQTGAVQEKKTAQGYSNESAWARGQAWGLYGFTVMYRETKNKLYLDQAVKISDFLLNHPNLPADKIPYWDFNAPDIPNALRDASAGAIMASALLELSTYTDRQKGRNYFAVAETALQHLSQAPYLAAKGTNGGFLLQHSVGHLPGKSEVDVPLTYADYYFIEALERYKNLASGKNSGIF